MKNNKNFINWLSKKIYLMNLSVYATIDVIMLLPTICMAIVCLPFIVSLFIAFFLVTILRSYFESMIIYEIHIKQLPTSKIIYFSLLNALILTTIYFFIKPKLGAFAIPVTIFVSLAIVKRLKKFFFTTKSREGFFERLSEKLNNNSVSMYGFYAFLVPITLILYKFLNLNFFIAFFIGYFIGMFFEEYYNLIKAYEIKLSLKSLTKLLIWTIICSLMSCLIIYAMMSYNYSGQVSTIISVIIMKLIQPLGTRNFILLRN